MVKVDKKLVELMRLQAKLIFKYKIDRFDIEANETHIASIPIVCELLSQFHLLMHSLSDEELAEYKSFGYQLIFPAWREEGEEFDLVD